MHESSDKNFFTDKHVEKQRIPGTHSGLEAIIYKILYSTLSVLITLPGSRRVNLDIDVLCR